MERRDKGQAASNINGARGMVVSIDSRSRQRPQPQQGVNQAEPVTQARLAQGLQLHVEEMRVSQALREFRLQLEADLAAGSEIENGELLYDRELKIVRRNRSNARTGG